MRVAVVTSGMAVLVAVSGCSGGEQGAQESASPPAPSASGTPVGKPNGVEELGPKAVLKRARKAADQARSVHVIAKSEGAELDMVAGNTSSDGMRSSGDVTIMTRVVDDTLYLKADSAYWKDAFGAKRAKKIGDKWVSGNLRNPRLKAWRDTTLKGPIMDQFLSPNGASEVGEVGTVADQPAVPVTTDVGTVWVATTGKPYALLITTAESAEVPSQADFTDWNQKINIKPPAKRNTIDLSELA